MRESLFDYPAIPMSIAAGLVLAVVVAAGIVFEDRFLRKRLHRDARVNDVVQTILTVFSALYGILLGLLAVGAYENMNSVEGTLTKEASTISVLFWNFRELPEPVRTNLQDGLQAYTREIVDHSLDQQAGGVKPAGEQPLIRTLFDTLNSFDPKTPREVSLQSEARRQLNDLQSARRERLSSSGTGIPAVLWWIVGLGAAITMLLVCVLDFPQGPHILFGCLLAFFVGAMIYVIAEMDNPFSGAYRVGTQTFEELLDTAPAR